MDFNSVASSRPPFTHGQVSWLFHLFRFLVGMSTFIFVVNHQKIVMKKEKIRNMAKLV